MPDFIERLGADLAHAVSGEAVAHEAAGSTRQRRSWLRPRRRSQLLAIAGSLAAAVVAFAVVNVLPSTQTPGGVGNAWARRVIARATAVLTDSGDGILHIQETDTVVGGFARNGTYRIESWQQQKPPYDYWATAQVGSDTTAMTVIGDNVDSYDASRNTLLERIKGPSDPPAEAIGDPAYRIALRLLASQNAGANTDGPTQDQSSASLSDLFARLLKTPGVTVDSTASLDGVGAISITGFDGRDTFYVQPRTYQPLEFVGTQEVTESGQSVTGTRTTRTTSWTTTIKFNTYQTLPAGSVSPPNLKRLHPTAKIQRPPGSR